MSRQKTLQELMKAANITQKELARRLKRSQPTVSEILNPKGNPTISTLREIADALSIEIAVVAAHYEIWNRDRSDSEDSGGEENN